MRRLVTILSGLLLTATARGESGADEVVRLDVVRSAAEAAPARPRLDDVFKSLADNAQQQGDPSHMLAVLVAAVALALMAIAIAHWNRRRAAKPRTVGDHKKLLDELARATGLSRRQLGRLVPAARAAGLSSPLVATICPSVLLKMAGQARSGVDRSTLASLSRQIARRNK